MPAGCECHYYSFWYMIAIYHYVRSSFNRGDCEYEKQD